MASDPFPDKRRGVWLMKWKPDPTGKWRTENLGKDPRILSSRPPKNPPQNVIDRAREFEEIEYRAKHGLAVGPSRAKPLGAYIVGAVEAFEATHKAGSTRQLKRHTKRFEAWAAARGITTVQGVNRAVCRDYLEHRIAEVSHDTLKTEMRYLMTVWSRAFVDGLIAANPWSKSKIPGKSTRSDPVFWSAEEVLKISEACTKPWQSDLVMVLANTGLRISTALAMRWDWLDWTTGVISIPREAAALREGVKTSYETVVNGTSRTVLQRRFAESNSPLVFPNPYRGHGEVPYDSAREAIARAIRKAGVKPGTPHDLRHSYARIMDRAGVPASVIQAQLGHTTATMTKLYTSSTAEEAAKHLENFGVGKPASPTEVDPSPRQA